MSKPFLLFRGPVETISGYGSHSRDLLWALREMDTFNIKIDSCAWGMTPLTALERGNEFHDWVKENTIDKLIAKPDVYVQVTVPNEFRPVGRYNIGITAGIETTVASKEWVDGCNRMDLVIVTSNFSKEVLIQSIYNETDNVTGALVNQYKITTPIEVLFEGVDTNVYNNQPSEFDLDIKEDFAFLFVGHWLRGDLGQDRKDVGMLIKTFNETFKGHENPPALILKTSASTFSVMQREFIKNRILTVIGETENPPPIYLLFGELTNNEMNELYNHPKVKTMITLTKGEGFGRPLLEFSMTGKPIIASNWSGHKDFLPMDKAIMVGGTLTEVHSSSSDDYIIKGSKWFTANYNEVSQLMELVQKDYDIFLSNAEQLRIENMEKFSLSAMKEKLESLIEVPSAKPKEVKIKLPELTKLK